MRWNPCRLSCRFCLSRDLYLLRTGRAGQTEAAAQRNENQPVKTSSNALIQIFRSVHVITQL